MSLGSYAEQQDRCATLRHYLEKMNVKVLNVTPTKEHEPQYIDIQSMHSRVDKTILASSRIEISSTWQVEMTEDQVSELVQTENRLYYSQRDLEESISRLNKSTERLRTIEDKIVDLKVILNEHPEIREQWDEFMVVMRMAGLKEPIA